MKTIIAIIFLIALSGCGGGSSPEPVQPEPVQSWVRIMLVDNDNHVDGLAAELSQYTNAGTVFYNPESDILMPLWPESCFTDYILRFPFLVNCSTDSTDINKAIRWAADNGMQVVNVRWGGCCFDDYYHAAAKYAWDRGVIVVWAAGNDTYLLDGPNSPYLFTVGTFADQSNYGPAVDYVEGNRFTSHSSIKAAGRMAELYEELDPTPDAAGAALIRDTFLARY